MSRTPKRKNSRSPRFSRLGLEVLEEQQLLSASPVAFEESAALVSCAELEPEAGQGLVSLDAPGSARVDAIDRERLLISWDWVPSATSYLVEVSDDQGTTWGVADEVYLSTRLVVEVPVNSSRYFRVAAKNSAGVSDYSEPVVGERILEGVSVAFDMVSTATGGLSAVRGAVRATGSCNRLGKYFTNCCFTADVDVWTWIEESAITATTETAESEPEIVASNEDLSDGPGATVEVANEEQAATVAVLADEGINAVGNPLEYEEVASSEKRFSTIGVAGGAIGGLFVAITL
ncbi:MAG: fibronectin type III domain-containing protein, partial [Thermoguttaceae bacterium]|nr:fibronectin type III domain-containing protein [Thermoguttaceae bacterium]